MSLFYNPKKYLLEAEDDQQPTDYTTDTGDDAPAEGGNETNTPEEAPEDYTVPDEDEGDNDDNNEETDTNDDAPVYNGDAGDTEDDTNEEDNNRDDNDGGTGDDTTGSDNDVSSENDDAVQQLTNDLFANFSPEQIAIKDKELKRRYFRLFEGCKDIIDRLNDVQKTKETLHTLTYVSNTLDELCTEISDYMTSTYNTLSYIENEINFNKYLGTLNGVSKLIEDLGIKIEKLKNKD